MGQRVFHYRWEWLLNASPEALWPLMSDTNRFNREAGVPAITRLEADGLPRVSRTGTLRLTRFGIPVVWEEQPFEWVRPYRFGVVRRYSGGPLSEMRILAEVTERPGGGSRLVYQVWAEAGNALGLLAIPLQIGVLSARAFDTVVRGYDALLAADAESESASPSAAARMVPGGRDRLRTLQQTLLGRGAAPDLLTRLTQLVEHGDDDVLARMRPYALADAWGVPRRSVLELCLLATRAGLLDFQWDLLCPLCRVAKQRNLSLADIEPKVHCDTCNIDFTVQFDRSVELTFRANPAIREPSDLEFCIGGPQVTPHVVAQQLLAAGADRSVSLPLEPGRYRVRALGQGGGLSLVVTEDGEQSCSALLSEAGWSREEPRLGPTPTLLFQNATHAEQLFILERMAWSDQAVTAADVTALQMFRDLFASEALRPGEQIAVGSLTVLFTDLRDSTRLYREIGDAPAFGRVMSHFDVLRSAIAAEAGALVKTNGDAVMAVFSRPAAAVRAVLRAQRMLGTLSESGAPLVLKAGIHRGPCIAVTLNERLDYFGSTVNIAARLESLSSGDDVVISNAVRTDPEVADLLAQPGLLSAERFEATLKGFDDLRFELWRLAPVSRIPRRLSLLA